VSYRIFDLEASQPLPSLPLSEQQTGFALLVRWNRRPIGFLMCEAPPGCELPAERTTRVVQQHFATRIVQEALRAEMGVPPEQDAPSITVAVCTKDRPAWLTRCLRSLLALQQPAEPRAPLEILVIDNAPRDEQTQQAVARLSNVRYAVEPKPGLDFARNLALREATGEIIAFVDDDVVVDRCWLAGLCEALRENRDAGAFTGLVLPLELETRAQILFEQRGGFRRGFDKIRYGEALPDDPYYPTNAGLFGTGANMAFRRELLLALGGFDEALDTGPPLPGGGDLDMFYRVVRSGHPLVYEPAMAVFHHHRRTLAQLRRQYWSWGESVMALIGKTHRTDPSQRAKLRRLTLSCWKIQLRRLAARVIRRDTTPYDLILPEIAGTAAGALGAYRRSEKRIAAIRQQYA